MAERRSTGKSRKSPRKGAGKVQFSEENSEDAAKRRAALENAIRKKMETEKRAHQIVERLLESNMTEDFLMDCAKFISPSHYTDIVEERSIVKICGYPICKNTLENVPKQKYKISTKTNKVYDITERKCFCSNFCYRASKYFETQIPKPQCGAEKKKGSLSSNFSRKGKEIEKPKRTTESGGSHSASSDEDGEPEQAFVSSVIPVPEQSHKDAELLQDSGNGTQEEKTPHMAEIDQKLADATARLSHCNLNDQKTSDLQRDTSGQFSQEVRHKSDEVAQPLEATQVVAEVTRRAVSKKGAEHLRKLLCKSKSHQATPQANVCPVVVKRSMLEVLTQTLNEWKSEDTLKYLFGTDYVAEHEEVTISSQVQDLDEDDLILDNDDAEDSSNSATTLNQCLPFKSEGSVSKPLPNYGKLREETKILDVRVREFFRGHYILPEEVEYEENEHTEEGPKEATSWAPPLPLVDSCSQQQIRRRIVIEKLKKVLPAILIPLQIAYSDISRELHDLVKTFRFTNTNIIHTVPEWSIIAIVLLSVLLPTMPLHKDSEQNPLYTQLVSKLLEELHFQKEDLECLKRSCASHTLSLSSV